MFGAEASLILCSKQGDIILRIQSPFCVDQPDGWRFEGDENIYKGVYNLVNHLDKMSGEKELNTMIKTAVLLRFLISNNYFEDEKTAAKKLTGDQAIIGKLLYTFQAGMNHNQHGEYQHPFED